MFNSIDEPLVRLLGNDASQSSDALAKQLNVSAATVRRRIRKLIKEETLRIVAVVDPDKVGLPVAAILALDVPHEKLEIVSDQLSALPDIKWVSTTTGKYNLMAFVRTDSTNGLSDLMQREMTKLEGIRSCETLICLRVKKGLFIRV